MADDGWRYVIETNLVGYLACARAATERMERQGSGGHLLFVGSVSTNTKVSVVQPGSADTDVQMCRRDEKRAAVAAQ